MKQCMRSRADFEGNYPPGAANDPCAPYNEVDPPEKLFDIVTSCTISKELSVWSDDYDPYGNNGAGELNEPYQAYRKNHHNIPELLNLLEKWAIEKSKMYDCNSKKYKVLQSIIEDCRDWTVDEEVTEQL
jgi:hypothetical protein